jgi:response regulator RpfG family c-di-GMP phosphodiesterase
VKPKVLLVDDAPNVRSALAAMLAPRYSVSTAADPAEAVALLERTGGVPVIVTDYQMPGGNGVELMQRVHATWPQTVGMLLTGRVDVPTALAALDEGRIFRLLSKPCSFDVLAGAIDDALARHEELEDRAREADRLDFENISLASFNELLQERLDRQTRALLRLNRLANELNAAHSLTDVAVLGARAAHELLGGAGVHVQLWDAGGAGPAGEASAGPEMTAELAVLPIAVAEGEVGSMTVDAARGLSSADRSLLQSVAGSIAVAAHHELRRRERDRAHHALILALARLSEARDHETGRHLERVAAYCRLIATGLREDGRHTDVLTAPWIEDLVRASPLHDIGKVGVPDSILLKPGRLSDEEWVVMRRHAELGARTLEDVMRDFGAHPLLTLGRDICWAHHEKWDGSGYPRGLAGEDIPLGARIMAVADVYDALTSVRPYKPAWPHAQAVEWIASRAGAHFDPAIAATFVARATRFDGIRAQLADADGASDPERAT